MSDNKEILSFISESGTGYKIRDTKEGKGLLFVISGPSGVGKGTLREKIFNIFSDLHYSISMTTRQPREGEKEGKDYYFISKDEFKKRISKDEFVEWALVHGDYKGTLKKPLIETLRRREDILLEIDVQGAMQVKKKYFEGIFIFIAPPSWKDLESRLRNRKTEVEESLKKRLKDARNEIKYIQDYNYLIVNDNIKVAIKKLESIIIAERCKIINNKKN